MAKQQKCPECPKGLPAWLATFGDLMSLLLCFFVLLLSFSTMKKQDFEKAVGSLQGALGVLPGEPILTSPIKLHVPIVRGDITAHDSKCLAKCTFNNVNAVHESLALSNPCAFFSIHADGVHFIEISERIELICQIAKGFYRANVAIHGINTLEGNQLRTVCIVILNQGPQMLHVIVTEDSPVGSRPADAFDHGRVVQFV